MNGAKFAQRIAPSRTTVCLLLLLTFSLLPLVAGCSALEGSVTRGKQKRTMFDLRKLAISLERYKVRHDVYPVADSVEELEGYAQLFIPDGTGADAWGKMFLVESRKRGYRLTSLGTDGKGGHGAAGPVGDPAASITLDTGKFAQYPATLNTSARGYENEIAQVTRARR